MSKWIQSADYDMPDEEPLEDMGNPEIPSSMIQYCHHKTNRKTCAYCNKMAFLYPRMLPFIPVEARDDKYSQKQRDHISQYVIDQNLVKPHIATIQTTITPSKQDCSVIEGHSSNLLLSQNETSKMSLASSLRSLLTPLPSSPSNSK